MYDEINQNEEPKQAVPTDLSQAMLAYQQQNKPVSEDPVQADEPGEGNQNEVSSGDGEGTEAPAEADISGVDDSNTGGFVPNYESYDYSANRQAVLESVNRQALQEAAKTFNELGIKKFGINDLYQRDEQTGAVTFVNPDDAQHPFTSRAQAQEWINSFNSQVDAEYRKLAYENQRKIYEEQQPTIRMYEFAPTYDRMSDMEKQIFDELIEPYTVNDSKGDPIGFSCDLNEAARRASSIASKFSQQPVAAPVTQEQPKQPSGPALDMKGSKTNQQPQQAAPTNLAEAMKLYNEQQKKGK